MTPSPAYPQKELEAEVPGVGSCLKTIAHLNQQFVLGPELEIEEHS